MSQLQQDITQPIEPFLKNLLSSLDLPYQSPTKQHATVELYATSFATSLKPSSAIVINGSPLIPVDNNSKLEFQKKWLQAPISMHQLNSFDCHLIPGTNTIILNSSGKVKFDESGRSRLGETGDLNPDVMRNQNPRPIWGSWFGFSLNLVIDIGAGANLDTESIDSFNYRFTYKPKDSIISL